MANPHHQGQDNAHTSGQTHTHNEHDMIEQNIMKPVDTKPIRSAFYTLALSAAVCISTSFALKSAKLIARSSTLQPNPRAGPAKVWEHSTLDQALQNVTEGQKPRACASVEYFKAKRAVMIGDLDAINQILSITPELVYMKDQEGRTLLHIAVEEENISIIVSLLAFSSDVNAVTNLGFTPLFEAWKRNEIDSELYQLLKRHGGMLMEPFDPLTRSPTTLVHVAALEGNVELLQYIIAEDDTAVARLDLNNWLPLHEAVRGGQTDAVEYLLDMGSDVNAPIPEGLTPLFLAWRLHGMNHPITELLLSHGGRLYEPHEMRAHRAASENDVEYLKLAVAVDPTVVNQKDANSWTPLHEAARSGSVECAEILVRSGADVNALTEYGSTPLSWANGAEIIQLLQRHGGKNEVEGGAALHVSDLERFLIFI